MEIRHVAMEISFVSVTLQDRQQVKFFEPEEHEAYFEMSKFAFFKQEGTCCM